MITELKAAFTAWQMMRKFRKEGFATAKEFDPFAVGSAIARGFDRSGSLQTAIDKPYAQHATVRRGVEAVSNAIGRFDYAVYREDTDLDEKVEGHWLPKLITKPGPLRRGSQLIDATVVSLELVGECFWLHRDIRRGGAGLPLRPHVIWVLDPRTVEPTLKGGELVGWKWNGIEAGVGLRDYSLEEVTFFRLENPYDPIRGLGRLQAAYLDYSGDWRAALWNRAWFENSAIPPIVFKAMVSAAGIPVPWPELDRKAFIESWDASLAGPRRAGKAHALPPGIEVQELGSTQKNMDLYTGRRYNREQVLSALGVTPAKAGVLEYANYANMGPQEKAFYLDTVLPRSSYIEAVITSDLLERYEKLVGFYFETEAVMAEVLAFEYQLKMDAALKLWSMGVPFEDINERLKLGFDVTGKPWLSEGFLPFSVVLAEQAMAPPEEPEEDEPALPPEEDTDDDEVDEEAEDEGEVDEEDTGEKETSKTEALARALTTAERTILWKQHAKQMVVHERAFLRGWRLWLVWLQTETTAAIRSAYGTKGALGQLLRGTDPVPLAKTLHEQLKYRLSAPLRKALEAGWKSAARELGGGVSFDLSSTRVQKLLVERTQSFVGASDTIANKLRNDLARGIAAGESPQQLIARVEARISQSYSGQAQTVARTESGAAYSTARVESMSAAGVTKHAWLTARDSKVRETHQIDGEEALIGAVFSNGLEQPHAAGAAAAEVANCRCTTIPVVEE